MHKSEDLGCVLGGHAGRGLCAHVDYGSPWLVGSGRWAATVVKDNSWLTGKYMGGLIVMERYGWLAITVDCVTVSCSC